MKVAVVGATGMVGEVMLKVLAERNFPVTELIPVASERSIGKEIEFKGKKFKVVGMQEAVNMKADIALFSAGGERLWNGRLFSQRLEPQSSTILLRGVWTRLKNSLSLKSMLPN